MEKNNFNLKNTRFSGKGRQLLHIYNIYTRYENL